MKAEERHRLKENDLARGITGLPYYLKEYGSYVVLALALVVLGYQLFNYWQRKQEAAKYQAWSEFEAAAVAQKDMPAQLQRVAESSSSKSIQAIAYDQLGNLYLLYLAAGDELAKQLDLKISREEAMDRAERAFKKVLSDYPDQPLAQVIAQVDLGVLAEDRGQWDQAGAAYKQVLSTHGGDTPFGRLAQEKLKALANLKKPVQFASARTPAAPQIDLTAPLDNLGPLPGIGDLNRDVGTQPASQPSYLPSLQQP